MTNRPVNISRSFKHCNCQLLNKTSDNCWPVTYVLNCLHLLRRTKIIPRCPWWHWWLCCCCCCYRHHRRCCCWWWWWWWWWLWWLVSWLLLLLFLFFVVVVSFVFSVAKLISVGRLLRNIHPSLQWIYSKFNGTPAPLLMYLCTNLSVARDCVLGHPNSRWATSRSECVMW